MTTTRLLLLTWLVIFSQLVSAQTFLNTTASDFTSTAVQNKPITVSAVPTNFILRQVNLQFGNGTSTYSGDLTNATVKLTDPSGNVIILLSPSSFSTSTIGNADHKYFNIHWRDHTSLKTPKQQCDAMSSTISKGYPFSYGYYRPQESFSSFNAAVLNGTWTVSISYASAPATARKYVKAELVFGEPFDITDIRTTVPNQSCDTKQCTETGKIYLAKNNGYPNSQANTPLSTNGCGWNSERNNSAWFYFTASATTAEFSVSGFSSIQETSAFISNDCTNFSIVTGGCGPTDLFSGSANIDRYYMGNYASGYTYNQGYKLSGLTVGQEYIFIIDGQSGAQSEFYVELLNGGDNGCCPTIDVTNTLTQPTCTTPTGSIAVVPSGGVAPYTFAWSNGATTQNITNLAAGTYTVTITDNNGCSTTKTYTLAVNTNSLTVTTTQTTQAACGTANGSANATVTGGTAPYTYAWSNGATTQNITNLAAGTYTLTVTDANGCTADNGTGVSITSSNGPTVTTTQTAQAACGTANGSANSTVTGGTAPYSYTWSNGATTQNINNLAAGTYTLTVTDANGCTADNGTGVTITSSNAPTVTTTQTAQAACGTANGSANATVTGGTAPYTYAWSNGATTQNITNLAAGTYTLTVTDANGCTANNGTGVTITSSNAPTVTTTQTAQAACGTANGSANSTVTGGTAPYTYAWSNGATTQNINNLAAGTYTLIVTDANGCTANNGTGVTITSSNAPTVTTTQTAQAACGTANGSANATVTGGTAPYSYAWSNGATTQNITNLAAGTYTLTVTDANGCTADNGTGVTITSSNAPTVTTTQTSQAACGTANGSANSTVTGGTAPYTYAWSNGATTQNITNLAAGTYTLIVTDANGCSANNGTGVTITSSNGPNLTFNLTQPTCQQVNGAATAIVTGGLAPYNYSWTPVTLTGASVTNLSPGNYSLTVTDQNNCATTQSFTIQTVTALVLTETVTPADCGQNNGAITVEVTGGNPTYTHVWSPTNGTTNSLANLSPGNYSVVVTDAAGCTATGNYQVDNTGDLGIAVTQSVITITEGESANLMVNIPSNYASSTILWTNSGTLSCATCPNPIASPTSTTTYYVEVTSPDGCVDIDSVLVIVRKKCGEIYIPSVFSPNGDGENDIFLPIGNCIEKIDFKIYNRWGEIVFESFDKSFGWDGYFKGTPVNANSFAYTLSVTLLSEEILIFSGNVSLVR